MMQMVCRIFASVAIFCAASVGHAQTRWTSTTVDSGTYLFGFANDPGGSLSIGCTAPSPQGRPAIETGSHESHNTDPYGLFVTFQDNLFDWQPPYTQSGAVLFVGQTGYRLPVFSLDELRGTAVYLSMADPMISALFEADRLVLDTGQGKAFQYVIEGLPEALDTTLRYCTDRWQAMGQPLPAALGRFATSGDTGEWLNNDTATSPNLPAIAQGHINRMCSGSGVAGQNGLSFGDIDGDGADDVLVDWSDTTCAGNDHRPFCGASLCSGDVLLSRNNYVLREGDVMLGMSHTMVQLDNGNMGVSSSGNLSMCQSQDPCGFISYWTGTSMDAFKFQ